MSTFESVTVLTTEERVGLYQLVFGDAADYVFNPERTDPLEQFLTNLRIGHGSIAVLDEAHFITPEVLAKGVGEFVDACESANEKLRMIVVCSGRKPGDALLAYLATYCHIFDIVCATEAIDLVSELEQLVHKPNRRFEALAYMEKRAFFCKRRDNEEHEKKHAPSGTGELMVSAGTKVRITIESVEG